MSILPDWLTSWFARVAVSVGPAVADAIHWAVHALAVVVLSVFDHVFGAWATLVRWLISYLLALGRALYWAGAKIWHILRVVIPDVIRWVRGWIAFLLRFIRSWVAWLWKQIRATIALLYQQIGRVVRWAWDHIFRPLWAWTQFLWRLVKAWAWVAFWYITHPGALAERLIFWIAASLERHAWELAASLGRFFTALFVRNLARAVRLFETILAAVL